MDSIDREIDWRAEAVKEHLTSIALLKALPNESDRQDFIKFLTKDVSYTKLTAAEFSHICYFLTGIINLEERNKLIRWPLLTKQDQTKFRKGLLVMINEFIEKYPWANVEKLPESYFLQPYGKQRRVLDFTLSLTNLAMNILLNDPTVLIKNPKGSFTVNELDQMCEVLKDAQLHEEKIMRNNIFPLDDFEKAISNIREKCVHLKQENDGLQADILNIKKGIARRGIIKKIESDMNLQEMNESKMLELKNLNDRLQVYHNTSVDILSKMKAATEPISISVRDFNCEKSTELKRATSDVCENLNQLLEQVRLGHESVDEEFKYLECLREVKKSLLEKRNVYHDLALNLSE